MKLCASERTVDVTEPPSAPPPLVPVLVPRATYLQLRQQLREMACAWGKEHVSALGQQADVHHGVAKVAQLSALLLRGAL